MRSRGGVPSLLEGPPEALTQASNAPGASAAGPGSEAMSGIEWCDKTWNPVTGCDKVSPGCAHCYAETMATRTWGTLYPRISDVDGSGLEVGTRERAFSDVWTHEDRLSLPLRWRKPARIFVNSMSDLFHEAVPQSFIEQIIDVIVLTPRHTYIVLTKRPERMHDVMAAMAPTRDRWPIPNLHLGVSVENQHWADRRIPILLRTPAARRIVSYEPALGPVNFERLPMEPRLTYASLDQIIVGGESGSKARPCHASWIRRTVEQCKSAGVACFVKQMGGHVIDRNDRLGTDRPPADDRDWPEPECGWDDTSRGNIERDLDGFRDGYQGAPVRIRLRDRKGANMAEWPADLRVREMP